MITRWAIGGLVAGVMTMTAAPAMSDPTDEAAKVGSFAGAFLAGTLAEADNDLDSAIAYYRRALTFQSDNLIIQQNLLLNLISTGRFDDAVPLAEIVRDEDDIRQFTRLTLGVDAVRDRRFSDAEALFDEIDDSDLDRLMGGLLAAWARLGEGDARHALDRIEALSGPEWYDIFLRYHRALIADAAGLEDEAREAYEAVVQDVAAGGAAPDVLIRAMEAYAAFLHRQGEPEAALEVVAEAEGYTSGRATLAALRTAIEAGDEVEAQVGDVVLGASEVLLNLASALNRGGGESFVRLYLQFALALAPTNNDVLVQLAANAEEQRRGEDAIYYYTRVSEDSPVRRIADLQRGLNLSDLDRHEEAEEHLRALLEQHPDDMRAYLALGGVYHRQEKYDLGAELYDRAVDRIEGEPAAEHWNIFYQRGIAYERLKQWERAEPNFKQALELYPDHPQVLNYLGYSWIDMNINLEEGLELIKRAVEQRPSDGYIVDSLGWAYYRLERFEEAVDELERAVSLMPNDPILNDHLGDAYWRVGRRLEANFQWRHARDMNPEDDLLQEVERKLADGLPTIEEERAKREEDRAGDDDADAASEHQEASAAGLTQLPAAPATPSASSDAVPASADHGVHIVGRGQSLWSIAAEELGDGRRFEEILELNPQLRGDPGRIEPGLQLRLPISPD